MYGICIQHVANEARHQTQFVVEEFCSGRERKKFQLFLRSCISDEKARLPAKFSAMM
jgi:hypothetical protein